MKERLIIIAIFVLMSFSGIISQTESPFEHDQYWSEGWRGSSNSERAPYWGDIPPDTGLWGKTEIGLSEPSGGYPMTSGIVVGVSDTFHVAVTLTNDDTVSFNISSYTVSNWFEPEVYDIRADVREDEPLETPSSFGWQFAYWEDDRFMPISQPTSLASTYDYSNFDKYVLIYQLWGLPAGRFRVMMDTTSYTPAGFRMIVNIVTPTWIINPTSKKDSINAYVGCIWRALSKSDLTAVSTWISQILTLNASSIPGYAMKAIERNANSDSLGYLAGLDSVIAIMERYGDPLLPDSVDMATWTSRWYHDILNIHKTKRWELVNYTYPYYE
jgi:hypothetical protein